MVTFGATDAEIHLETDALTLEGYTIEQTRAEVQGMAESARAKGFGDRGYSKVIQPNADRCVIIIYKLSGHEPAS